MKRKWNHRRVLKVSLLLVLGLFVVLEFSLRYFWGFRDAVLYKADPEFEYIAAPGQNRYRFRHHIYFNAFSQRNRELSKEDSLRILLFGDSVVNGGSQIDQDSLASSKLSDFWSKQFSTRVLAINVSTGSWGPDNCYAYLRRYGVFDAKKIILVVSSHDAFDDMDFQPVVDVHPNYPSHQYKLATWELIDRYLVPRIFKKKSTGDAQLMINKRNATSVFNSGFNDIARYAGSKNIPLLVYLHADRSEWTKGKYNEQGDLISDFCKTNGVPMIRELDHRASQNIYLDDIHLNDAGQQYMYELLKGAVTRTTNLH